jgi:hypothetical protein
MSKKSGFASVEGDRNLIRENSHSIREALFACVTDTEVESAVAFARYLSRAGLNSDNYWLFLRLVVTNNPWVLEELMRGREPRLLFSSIPPGEDVVEAAFQCLYARHPDELHPMALEALLGIIENCYFHPDDGFRIRKISIMDINALGKFLIKGEKQDHPVNSLVLAILDRLTRLGEYFHEPDKVVLSKQAFSVRFAYFDSTRNLPDAIPQPLLARMPDSKAAAPEQDYADLVSKRGSAAKRAGADKRKGPGLADSGRAVKKEEVKDGEDDGLGAMDR